MSNLSLLVAITITVLLTIRIVIVVFVLFISVRLKSIVVLEIGEILNLGLEPQVFEA